MFKLRKSEIVGIDIGSSSVKFVQIKEKKGTYHLQNLGILPLSPEAIVDNTLMDSSSIAETIKQLLANLDSKANEATCSVSGNSVIIRRISMSAMSPQELEEQIQWELEQYIPFDINDVHVDTQILDVDAMDPSKMYVLLVASKKDIVNDYLAVFNEAGIKLAIMDVDSFALLNTFEINYGVNQSEVLALFNIGAGIMNIVIVKNGFPLFTRDVQMGGNLYTQEIQKQFGVSSDEAERMKINLSREDDPRVRDLVSRVNETLAQEVRRSLDFYNSTAGEGGRISKIYLAGGGAKISMLPELISQKLGIPVEIINPFLKIEVNEKDFDSEYLQEIGPLVTVAIGLATRRPDDK
jgi:type IV pilus assembly protein PilM